MNCATSRHDGAAVAEQQVALVGRIVRKMAGAHGLAFKVAAQVKTQIAEGRFFPKPVATWDPLFANHVDDYLARNESHLVNVDGARRYALYTLRVYWVPMAEALRRPLWALPSRDASPWVFPNAAGTGPDDAREFVRLVFKPALRYAGVADFRWKDLRHSFASWLRRKGEGLDVIGELLGHGKNSPMTQRYAHLSPDMKHAAVRGLSGLLPAVPSEGAPDRGLTVGGTVGSTRAHPRVLQ